MHPCTFSDRGRLTLSPENGRTDVCPFYHHHEGPQC